MTLFQHVLSVIRPAELQGAHGGLENKLRCGGLSSAKSLGSLLTALYNGIVPSNFLY